MGHGVKVIEIFKFCLCVSIPIGMSVIYADSDLMHKLVRRYKFIEYPKADTITKEDVAKALADMKKEAR